jgi:hypothetical protein
VKAPPLFPVVAPPKTGTSAPPIPHLAVSGAVVEQETPAAVAKVPLWKKKPFQIGALAAVLVLGVGGYFAFTKIFAPPPPPPPVVVKPKPAPAVAKPAAAAATLPAAANKPAQSGPALSETQSAIAHAPVNAINKAQAVINARKNSGQSRDAVGAITDGEDAPAKPGETPAPKTTPGSRSIAPGVTATTSEVEATAEASAAFRAFVANAKISGVVVQQGRSAVMMINNRLARVGETVEAPLGVTFDGYDVEKNLIIFKDKSGAIVTRRRP